METPKTIGLLGLGAMGRPMARHMLAAGYRVIGFDPDVAAANAGEALGISLGASPADVAMHSDMVIIVVGFDSQVETVLFKAEDGVLAGARPGLIVALASTVPPSYTTSVAERTSNLQLRLIDIPITRGEAAAEEGTLLILGGGDEEVFEACRPVLCCFAGDIDRLGAFGAGQVGKMVNNFILWACISANDEALRLGQTLGVDPEQLRAALHKSSAQNWPMSTRADERPIPWAEKDMAIVIKEATSAGLEVPFGRAVEMAITEYKRRRGLAVPKVD